MGWSKAGRPQLCLPNLEVQAATGQHPSHPCVCVCGRRRDLGCFVTAVWHCKGCQPSRGHCSLGSREGTGIRQPMSYFIPALMGTARTSGYKALACSGLAPFSSFRDPGRRGDKEHCCSPPYLCRICFSSSPQPLCCCQDTEQPRQPRRNPRTGLAASWRGDALPGFGGEGVSPLTSCSPASPQAAVGGNSQPQTMCGKAAISPRGLRLQALFVLCFRLFICHSGKSAQPQIKKGKRNKS